MFSGGVISRQFSGQPVSPFWFTIHVFLVKFGYTVISHVPEVRITILLDLKSLIKSISMILQMPANILRHQCFSIYSNFFFSSPIANNVSLSVSYQLFIYVKMESTAYFFVPVRWWTISTTSVFPECRKYFTFFSLPMNFLCRLDFCSCVVFK